MQQHKNQLLEIMRQTQNR